MDFLGGLRVVEVSLLAPNMLGMHLAELGADVIKVEEPVRGDYTRHVGSASAGDLSFLHLRWNRGKRSIALDLRTAAGVAVFRQLVGVSDVVVEGMRPGALERRGLAYRTLAELRPTLVFCALSGFGQTGPYRDLATHGVAYDAYAGLAPPEETEDGFPTIPRRYLDVGTQAGALYAAMAVLAAVIHARATGRGAYLDVAQADAAAAWSAAGRVDPLLSGLSTNRDGPDLQSSVRYQYYRTADHRTVLFQASERHFFERFCRAVEREDLLTGGGSEFGEHARGDTGLRRELAAIFATRTQEEWIALFIDADVPGSPVHTTRELLDDPHFRARAQVSEQDHPQAGALRMLDTPIRSDRPPSRLRPAPAHGEHTDEVLEELGVAAERIAALRDAGVVA
jgi:crotonobetainyl-CoA:carnitine CoA-transferase CaiB-like acyl-CoA transferase